MKEKRTMKKRIEKIVVCFCTLLLTVTAMPLTAFARKVNTPKEEVVYISIHPDGSLKEIHVVNSFEPEDDGQILDYGEYEELRNMTTVDKINYENGKITINTGAGKLYYEGKLTDKEMPWLIVIHYNLDGKEYLAEDIAGKSGKLKLTMSIQRNPRAEASFFNGYALQATFLLDTKKCKNIVAEGATIANVGKNKQITYTILPGRETQIEITSTVEAFEMEGIAINGVRLSMDMDIDEADYQDKLDEITDAVTELDDGVGSLKEGTGKLQTGADELYDGTDKLYQGISTLGDGVNTLYSATGTLVTKVGELHSGVGSLSGGINELSDGLGDLAGKNAELTGAAFSVFESLCVAAETQLSANGITVDLTPANYADVLNGISGSIDTTAVREQAYQAALKQVTAQINAQAEQLYEAYVQSLQAAGQNVSVDDLTEEEKEGIRNQAIQEMMNSSEVQTQIENAVSSAGSAITAGISSLKSQLDSYNTFYQGLLAYTSGVGYVASGAVSLQNGANTLYSGIDLLHTSVYELHAAVGELREGTTQLDDGAKEVNEGVKELSDGAKKLDDGARELADGTGKFTDEVSGLDSKVEEEIDSLLSSVLGEEEEIVSFVSEKNTQIRSVQFVIKTDAIQVTEAETVVEEVQESVSFWEKLTELFKGE
ncbi:MAG: hypothetical protein IJP31_11900 [Lachnospiraceae bacterium]|nr:hypothetical protein [Lachnospiraceae bacterium]